MKKVIVIILLFILAVSCTKELEIKEGDIEGIVINSILTSDSIIKVNISRVNGIENSDIQFLDSVYVELYRDETLIGIFQNIAKGWYRVNHTPDAGVKYSLRIKDLNDRISANTVVPEKVEIYSAEYSLVDFVSDVGENYKVPQTILKFIDDPKKNNYYEVFLAHIGIYQIGMHINSLSVGPLVDSPILLNEGDENYYPTTYFFSDELFNGDTCKLVFYEGGTAMETEIGFQEDDHKTDIILRSISKEYYLYRKYWTRHYFNQQNAENVDDPLVMMFQGIPIEMYSNVNGGYGIFAAYSQDSENLIYIP